MIREITRHTVTSRVGRAVRPRVLFPAVDLIPEFHSGVLEAGNAASEE